MYKYLTPSTISKCIKKGSSEIDSNTPYIGSSIDVLYLSEELKDVSSGTEYMSYYDNLNISNIYWADLDKDIFLENAFENKEEYGDEVRLRSVVQDYSVPPYHTCNYVSIKPNETSCFWDESVYEEMINSLS